MTDRMGWMRLVIIGHGFSKSTFGANNHKLKDQYWRLFMPGASDIELLLCTIFNVKSTLPLTKEADVQCMGTSIPDAPVSYIPVGNQGFPDCFASFYTIDKIG